jgi:hypothetical protein
MDGMQWPAEKKQRHAKVYKVLVVLNIVCPILESLTAIPADLQVYVNTEEKPITPWELLAIATDTIDGFLTCYSGCILIMAVFKIKKFYREHGIESQLNTGTLWLHSSAFGLYLFTEALSVVSNSLYVLFGAGGESAIDNTIDSINAIVQTSWFFLSAIAQCLLCVIFWDLGTRREEHTLETNDLEVTRTTFKTEVQTVVVEDFDEDAELQAKIWNQFSRKR